MKDMPDNLIEEVEAESDGEDFELAYDAGSKSAYRKNVDKARLAQIEARAFWRGVLKNKVGRAEIWKVLSVGHAFEAKFGCSPSGFDNPYATWFHAGEQSAAHAIWIYLLKIDKDGCIAMMEENDPSFSNQERNRSLA